MTTGKIEEGVNDMAGLEGGNSRRGFLKMFGAAAAGGVGAMVLPNMLQAETVASDVLAFSASENSKNSFAWDRIRAKFDLDPRIIYMNTGTEGSMPRPVQNKLFADLKQFAKSPTYSVLDDEEFGSAQHLNRARVADFMGATEDEIILANNTTMGMNVVLQGLDFVEGDEIITTRHDHLGGTSPMHILRDRNNITVTELLLPTPVTDKQEIVDIFEAAINGNTKMLCFCHINYTTGLRMPVKELCGLARDYGLMTLIDGAHSLGMVDIDLHDMGCDFYACAGHKWLNGPPGTGVLYIKDGQDNPLGVWPVLSEMYDLTKPIYPGGPSIFTYPLAMQIRGQLNTPAFSGMVEAMNFQDSIGKDVVEQRILALNDYLKEKLTAEWGADCLLSPGPGNDDINTGLAAFVPSIDPAKRKDKAFVTGVVDKLRADHQVWFRYTSFYDTAADLPGRFSRGSRTYGIRVSTHIFNSYKQIDEAFAALKEVVATM